MDDTQVTDIQQFVAQLEHSAALNDAIVDAWLPDDAPSSSVLSFDQLFPSRPERLGVGATPLQTQEAIRQETKLKTQLLAKKRRGDADPDTIPSKPKQTSKSDSEEEESRSKAIKSKPPAVVNDISPRKKKKRKLIDDEEQKKTPTTTPSRSTSPEKKQPSKHDNILNLSPVQGNGRPSIKPPYAPYTSPNPSSCPPQSPLTSPEKTDMSGWSPSKRKREKKKRKKLEEAAAAAHAHVAPESED